MFPAGPDECQEKPRAPRVRQRETSSVSGALSWLGNQVRVVGVPDVTGRSASCGSKVTRVSALRFMMFSFAGFVVRRRLQRLAATGAGARLTSLGSGR